MKNDKTYVLMSGWARSGAALTSSMINAHTEASFSVDVVKYFNFCYPRYPFLNQESLIIMLQEMQLRLKARFSIDLDFDYCIQVIGKNINHPHVYKVLMDHIVNQNSHGKIIGEYEGVSWGKIPYFLDNIENSKAMIIVRDPRDVLLSFKKNTIAPGNDYLITVFNYLSLMDSWIKYEKKYPNRILGVRFEDLKSNPEEIMQNVTNFLNIDFEVKMLDSKNWKKLRGNKWEDWENHNSSSFRNNNKLKSNPVGRWRGLIDPVDHFICEWVLKDVMTSFNMDLEFANPSKEIFKLAIDRLISSPLLSQAFFDYIYKSQGTEKYPIDPCNPHNWDKRYIDNIALLDLQ
jgi:hypothetical protein